MKIGVDVDGVLRDFMGKFIAIYRQDYPSNTTKIEDVNDWNLNKFFTETEDARQYYLDNASRIFPNAGMYPGCSDFLRQIKELGHNIIIITHQLIGTEKYTQDWLTAYNVPYDSLVFTADKTIVDADIYIDDGLHYIDAYNKAGKRAVIFDRPWNQNFAGERAYTYNDFIKLLTKG